MKIVAFAGGVGGSKLADGLSQCLDPKDLTIIVNTADDFEHWGLRICPDLDTVMYTLAGLSNPLTGWGRADETWQVLDSVRKIGGIDWFQIGDKDLAIHLERTRRLKSGKNLTQITNEFCDALNIKPSIIPMTDDSVGTMVDTLDMGEIPFQNYFVQHHCDPIVRGFRFEGINNAHPAEGVCESILKSDAVIFCPSNPWVSIDPILNINGILPALYDKKIIAVSPIIGGQTIKGPAAKMFAELGIDPSSAAVAKHYQGIITGFVLDNLDFGLEETIQNLGIKTLVVNTIMKSTNDRLKLAQDVLNLI